MSSLVGINRELVSIRERTKEYINKYPQLLEAGTNLTNQCLVL